MEFDIEKRAVLRTRNRKRQITEGNRSSKSRKNLNSSRKMKVTSTFVILEADTIK